MRVTSDFQMLWERDLVILKCQAGRSSLTHPLLFPWQIPFARSLIPSCLSFPPLSFTKAHGHEFAFCPFHLIWLFFIDLNHFHYNLIFQNSEGFDNFFSFKSEALSEVVRAVVKNCIFFFFTFLRVNMINL